MSQTTLAGPPLKIRLSMSANKIDTFSNECDDSLLVSNSCTYVIRPSVAQTFNCKIKRKNIFAFLEEYSNNYFTTRCFITIHFPPFIWVKSQQQQAAKMPFCWATSSSFAWEGPVFFQARWDTLFRQLVVGPPQDLLPVELAITQECDREAPRSDGRNTLSDSFNWRRKWAAVLFLSSLWMHTLLSTSGKVNIFWWLVLHLQCFRNYPELGNVYRLVTQTFHHQNEHPLHYYGTS